MASASVILKEVDLSTRVPSPAGLAAGIVLPADKGPVMAPQLITSEGQMIDVFGKPNPKLGIAHYSALNYLIKADKLWVTRIAPEAKYATLLARVSDSAANNLEEIPVDNPDTTDVVEDQRIDDLDSYIFTSDEDVLLITAANQGTWGEEIAVEITPSVHYEDDAIIINIYKQWVDAGVTKREFLDFYEVSTNSYLDGFGKQMFAENKINGISPYINVKVNGGALDVNTNKVKLPKPTSANIVNLSNASDGITPTIGNYMLGADMMANSAEYKITMFMDGGVTQPAYQIHLNTIAETRQDCVALLSVDPAAEDSLSYVNDIVQYRIDTQINSSYSGLYSPHVKMYDKYNDVVVEVSPDGFVAASVSDVATNKEIWVPPAGWNNGKVAGLGITRVFTKGERDVLYDNGVNPLKQYPGKGISIWGQKTLQAKPSALDRINVRLLLIYIQPSIMEFLEFFVFELNDRLTRLLVAGGITAFMDNIKGRGGVYDFAVVCDESNNSAVDIDNYKLNVDLYLKPTKAAEYINFRTILTTTGADFGEVKLV